MVLTASLLGLGRTHVSHPSTDAMPQTHPQIKHGVLRHLLREILVVIRGLGRSTWKSRHGGSFLGGLRTTRSLVGEMLAWRPEVWVWMCTYIWYLSLSDSLTVIIPRSIYVAANGISLFMAEEYSTICMYTSSLYIHLNIDIWILSLEMRHSEAYSLWYP